MKSKECRDYITKEILELLAQHRGDILGKITCDYTKDTNYISFSGKSWNVTVNIDFFVSLNANYRIRITEGDTHIMYDEKTNPLYFFNEKHLRTDIKRMALTKADRIIEGAFKMAAGQAARKKI